MRDALSAWLLSFGVVFLAEMGDKSQLIALTFAARYRPLPVLVGITIATSAVHLVSVAVGYGLGAALPTSWITAAAAVAYFGFAAWTLKGDALSATEQNKAGRKNAADAIAIALGRQLGKRIRASMVQRASAVLFAAFGVVLLSEATSQLTGWTAWHAVAGSIAAHRAGWVIGGTALVLCVLAAAGRGWANVHRPRMRQGIRPKDAARWSGALIAIAAGCGLAGPALVTAGALPRIKVLDSPGVALTGFALMLTGAAVAATAVRQMGMTRQNGESLLLARRGPYAHFRHPVVTGGIAVSAGLLLLAPTVPGAVATVLLAFTAQIESRRVCDPRLAAAGGTLYDDYHGRTGRFLPKLRIGAAPRAAGCQG